MITASAPLTAPATRVSHADRVSRSRVRLADGSHTTVHIAAFDAARTEVRVAVVRGQARLEEHCARRGVPDAIVGGFFTRPDGLPLGEVRTRGVLRRHAPFLAPYATERACVHVQGGALRIAARHELQAAPRGDLLQAGPLLVRDGAAVYDRTRDPEGFSLGAAQFDSDITDGRHPRAALALAGDRVLAVACDGRAADDSGLTLEELADLLAGLGASSAINLDGGGSTSLVVGGRLRNHRAAATSAPSRAGGPSRPRSCSSRGAEGSLGATKRTSLPNPLHSPDVRAPGVAHHGVMLLTGADHIDAEAAFDRAARARRRAALLRRLGRTRAGCPRLAVFDGRPTAAQSRAMVAARGVREIPLDAISGTLEPSRAEQFDSRFRPARSARRRWQRVWLAEQQGRVLPPISVVLTGDGSYALRDGHHRVSVARARGAVSIDASVDSGTFTV